MRIDAGNRAEYGAEWEIHHSDAITFAQNPSWMPPQFDTMYSAPPFWRRWDYAGAPLVWDARPGCQHPSWVDLGTREGRAGKIVTLGESCLVCPAWRGTLAMEPTPLAYVDHLVAIYSEFRYHMKPSSNLWVLIGDCYLEGSLVGVPWLLAQNMKIDGWAVADEIIWEKNNPQVGAANHTTRSHETLFRFTLSRHAYYDPNAAKEPTVDGTGERRVRSVWTMPIRHVEGAPFEASPRELVRRCIVLTTPPGGIVIDPFVGSGTTVLAAVSEGRKAIGIDISTEFCELAAQRIRAEHAG